MSIVFFVVLNVEYVLIKAKINKDAEISNRMKS